MRAAGHSAALTLPGAGAAAGACCWLGCGTAASKLPCLLIAVQQTALKPQLCWVRQYMRAAATGHGEAGCTRGRIEWPQHEGGRGASWRLRG